MGNWKSANEILKEAIKKRLFQLFLGGGAGGPDMTNQKLIICCFLKEENQIYLLVFTSSKNIDRSQGYRWSKVSVFVYFYSTHDFQTRFAAHHNFSNFKIYLLLQFASYHPKLSGCVPGMKIKKMIESNFRPLNLSYWILKTWIFDDFLGF